MNGFDLLDEIGESQNDTIKRQFRYKWQRVLVHIDQISVFCLKFCSYSTYKIISFKERKNIAIILSSRFLSMYLHNLEGTKT